MSTPLITFEKKIMEKFVAYNPVRLHFGEGVVNDIGNTVTKYGKKALLVYGMGSVKRFGYFNTVYNQLISHEIEVVEFSGIKPNPVIEDVHSAVELGKKESVDVIVALGGGSVIDSAKIISLGIASEIDPWKFMTWEQKPAKAIPLITVLTLAATGTEMNAAAVVQSHDSGRKIGFVNPLIFPKESFLDPSFTVSVPRNYTAYGIVDLIAHAMEAFFGKGEPSVIDQITIDIIKDAMYWGPKLLSDLDNVDLRSKIMLDATLALNGLTSYGKVSGDWAVHGLGHELSLLFDTAHGASLSIAYPAWLKLQSSRIPDRIIKLGNGLFGVSTVDETINKLKAFFRSIESPVSLSESNINEDNIGKIKVQYLNNKISGMHHQLIEEDYDTLLDFMKQG